MRPLVETIIGLTIAVSLVRTLATEGYMISTGSMAPTLLGYHRAVECPDCGLAFERGSVPARLRSSRAAIDDPAADAARDARGDDVLCPHCQRLFRADGVRTEGDQLLVHKQAFALRDPRRWEVIVFRSPDDPAEAYIKRTAGLPGETICIDRGDVIADGRLCRKDAATQAAMKLPVSLVNESRDRDDDAFAVASRWRLGRGWTATGPAGSVAFVHDGPGSAVRYQHRVRFGEHLTRVRVNWPDDQPPEAKRLRYERDNKNSNIKNNNSDDNENSGGALVCRGVLPADVRDRLLTRSDDPAFVAAINRLHEQSQLAPIADVCGYNQPRGGAAVVRDLLAEGRATLDAGASLSVRLLYGRQPFVMTLARDRLVLSTLGDDGCAVALGQTTLPDAGERQWSLSVFDRQVLVTLDGVPALDPVPFAETALTDQTSRSPLTVAATGRVRLTDLGLWRDVYVTPPPKDSPLGGSNAESSEPSTAGGLTLGPDDFLVLGDNSPVSVDSRRWSQPTVPRSSLIGKPLVVHLPSRQVELPVAGAVRVPAWDRVRVVR